MLNHHHLPPDCLPEGKGESRGAAVVEGRGDVGQAEAEDGGHRHEEEGQGGEEEGKLKQDFNIDCLNIIPCVQKQRLFFSQGAWLYTSCLFSVSTASWNASILIGSNADCIGSR